MNGKIRHDTPWFYPGRQHFLLVANPTIFYREKATKCLLRKIDQPGRGSGQSYENRRNSRRFGLYKL